MKSEQFKRLQWPTSTQDMEELENSDIADAKRSAMTGVCYASRLGIISTDVVYPDVWMPDEATGIQAARVAKEGWIFSPKRI